MRVRWEGLELAHAIERPFDVARSVATRIGEGGFIRCGWRRYGRDRLFVQLAGDMEYGAATFSYVALAFPPARDAAMITSALLWAASAIAAYYVPKPLARRIGLVGSVVMLLGACLVAFVGAVGASPLLACTFCVLYSASLVFPQMMVVTGLSLLKTNRQWLACIAAALVAASLARCLPVALDISGGG